MSPAEEFPNGIGTMGFALGARQSDSETVGAPSLSNRIKEAHSDRQGLLADRGVIITITKVDASGETAVVLMPDT